MFRVAIGLLVLAIIAAIFGFGGLAGTATEMAKIVFIVALVLAVVSFLVGGRGGGVIPVLALVGTMAYAGTARADTYVEPAGPESSTTRAWFRHGLTLGGGLGIGHISCDGEDCDGANGAAGLDLHIGSMLAPNLGLVLDVWAMSHDDQDYGTFTHAIVTGALRFWLAKPLWIQGGIGVAQASYDYEDDVVDYESTSDTVPAVMGAIGLELLSSRSFALELALRAGTGFFENDVEVRNVSLGVGVSWY
jgi:uncharacterized membrane protein YtjA (UPF0391 family)